MTAFYFSRSRVAFNLLALPLTLLRVMFSAAGSALREVREDIVPAVRYVLTGTDVPGATRAAVKSGVSSAASAVSSPVAGFFRKYIRNRAASLLVLLLLPFILLYAIGKTVWEEEILQDLVDVVKSLVLGIFDNRPL